MGSIFGEADNVAVVSVFPDTMLQLHTTRSWDFLEGKASRLSHASTSHDKYLSTDVIVGIIDTGNMCMPHFNSHFLVSMHAVVLII